MNLFLLRHAQAEAGGNDTARRLSATGEQTARALGTFLRRQGVPLPPLFEHSPYLRARQTAEILAGTLETPHDLSEREGMTPADDVVALAQNLCTGKRDRLLVGHEPHLGALASLLVCDDVQANAFDLQTGTLLCLEHRVFTHPAAGAFSRWSVKWMLIPGLFAGY